MKFGNLKIKNNKSDMKKQKEVVQLMIPDNFGAPVKRCRHGNRGEEGGVAMATTLVL